MSPICRHALIAVVIGAAPLHAQTAVADSAITAAEASARHWFALLADANYRAAWEQASTYFKAHVGREQWVVNAEPLELQFHRVGQRKLVEARWLEDEPPLPRADYVVLRWVTDLPDQRQVGERMIVAHEADGQWRPATYDLFPNVYGNPLVLHDSGHPGVTPAPAEPPRNTTMPGKP